MKSQVYTLIMAKNGEFLVSKYMIVDETGDDALTETPETLELIAKFLVNQEARATRIYDILNKIEDSKSTYRKGLSYDRFSIDGDGIRLYGSDWQDGTNEFWVSFDDFFNDEYHLKVEQENAEKLKREAEKIRLAKIAAEKKALEEKEARDKAEYERLKAKFG